MKQRATTFQIVPQIREHLKKSKIPPDQTLTASTPTTDPTTAPTPTTDSTTVPPEQTPATTTDLTHNLHVVSSEHGSRPISLARDVLQRLERLERREQQRVLSLLLVSQWSSQNIFDFLVSLQKCRFTSAVYCTAEPPPRRWRMVENVVDSFQLCSNSDSGAVNVPSSYSTLKASIASQILTATCGG